MFVFKKRKTSFMMKFIHAHQHPTFSWGGGVHLEANMLVESTGINAGISDGSGLVRS